MFAAMFPVVAVLFDNLYALHDAREREIRDCAFQTGQRACRKDFRGPQLSRERQAFHALLTF